MMPTGARTCDESEVTLEAQNSSQPKTTLPDVSRIFFIVLFSFLLSFYCRLHIVWLVLLTVGTQL